jgi:dsRNA-specific ribonuclease
MEFVQIKMEENNGRMKKIEETIGYKFKNRLWLVEALTHKSYIDQNKPEQDRRNYFIETQSSMTVLSEYSAPNESVEGQSSISDDQLIPYDDYERLEFLGDAILNFLIAEHFY